MATAPLAADDPAIQALIEDVSNLEKQVFRADTACALTLPGASRAGIEAVIASLVEPGDRVLVGVYGHFGELLCTLATRHGATVERVDAEWGTTVDVQAIVSRVRETGPKLVAIVHADTSTGIVQPLSEIGAACRESGALLLVDCVLSIGGCEVDVAGWDIDAAVGGLQKCLGGPPGLALVTLSERAQGALSKRAHSAYLDLSRSIGVSTSMVLGAREALRIVLEEGLESRWRRHRAASEALRAGLAAMGLELFTKKDSVPMITLVKVPRGIDEAGVRQQLLLEHGIEIMAAFGPLRGNVWRIGTMGTNARLPSVLSVLGGLEAVLASRGFSIKRGAAVDAATQLSRQLL
jgi:(S)-ureidoglycine---glyoxylate transaminase